MRKKKFWYLVPTFVLFIFVQVVITVFGWIKVVQNFHCVLYVVQFYVHFLKMLLHEENVFSWSFGTLFIHLYCLFFICSIVWWIKGVQNFHFVLHAVQFYVKFFSNHIFSWIFGYFVHTFGFCVILFSKGCHYDCWLGVAEFGDKKNI